MEYFISIRFLKIAGISAVVFIVLDYLWLAVVASSMYRQALGYLANLDPDGKITFNIPAGLAAQIAISLLLSILLGFVLRVDHTLATLLWVGAIGGFLIYVVYDFTNLSFVKGWPVWISLIDIIWGGFQGLVAGALAYYLFK
jgi:uncharacterized membrane protein